MVRKILAMLALVMLAVVMGVTAAVPVSAQPDMSSMRVEVLPPVMALSYDLPGSRAASSEQWVRVFGQTWVRNVNHPALYPVLPKNGRNNFKAVIIVPGGGYNFVSIGSEGFDVAERLAAQGYTAFVLKYHVLETPAEADQFMPFLSASFGSLGTRELPDHPPAVEDLAAAIRMVHERSGEWNYDPGSIGVVGFSAGSRTAIRLLENHPEEAALLDHVALIYPPMERPVLPGPRPDLFVAIAANDPLFRQGGLGLLQSWLAESPAVEFHLYSGGDHGFGMRPQGTTSDGWIDQYLAWLSLQ